MLNRHSRVSLAMVMALGACHPPVPGPDPSATGPGPLSWSTHFATGLRTRKVAVDSRGAVVVLAPLGTSVTQFGSHSLRASTRAVGDSTVFVGSVVAKLDDAGQVLWAVPVDNGDYHPVSGLAVDHDGHVYVSGGALALTVDAVPLVTSQNDQFGFLIKLDGASGAVLWSKVLTSARGSGSATVYSASCDFVASRGAHVALNCYCDGTSELVASGPSGVEWRAPCHGVYSAVLAMLDANSGALEWSTSVWSAGGHTLPLSVQVDDQGAAFASFLGDLAFSDSGGSAFPTDTSDGVTVKYAGGSASWARPGAGPLAWSASGTLAVVSHLEHLLESVDADTGASRWSWSLASSGTVSYPVTSVAVDALGRVTVSSNLQPVAGFALPATPGCLFDSFMLLRWSARGAPVWSQVLTPETASPASTCAWYWDDTPIAATDDGALAWGVGARGNLTLHSQGAVSIAGPDAVVLRFAP